MDWGKLFSVLLQVITDYRVIIIFVCIILYLNFVFFVSRYHKQDRHSRTKKRSSSVIILPEESTEVNLPDDE